MTQFVALLLLFELPQLKCLSQAPSGEWCALLPHSTAMLLLFRLQQLLWHEYAGKMPCHAACGALAAAPLGSISCCTPVTLPQTPPPL
jgi:hypothetical protein